MRLKRLQKLSWMLLVLLSVGLGSSCATPPNIPICVELIPGVEGQCFYTISGAEFTVNDTQLFDGKTWAELDDVSLRLPPQSAAKIKAYILKMCKKTGSCKSLGKLRTRAARIESVRDEKGLSKEQPLL